MNWVEDYKGKLINLDLVSWFKIRDTVEWGNTSKKKYIVVYEAVNLDGELFFSDKREDCEMVMAKLRCCVDSFKISEYAIFTRG